VIGATACTAPSGRAVPYKAHVTVAASPDAEAPPDDAPPQSASLGLPNAGALLDPVRLEDGAEWQVLYPDNAWATAETVASLKHALEVAYERLPAGTPKAYVGDLSSRWGGPLPPHRSHQSGRDVDIGYFRVDPENWFANASARTLDAARTWVLVRTLVTQTDVEVIFIDRSLQRTLVAHARAMGEDAAWLDGLFQVEHAERALIRHEPEHLNHLHVRFYNPIAQRRGLDSKDPLTRGLPRPPEVVIPKRRLPP
jgi:penicillin-insensitive murein endopeptidase